MSKLEVLCPNGHRVIISVLPTSKIIKVLEEACLKKGFIPCHDYDLRHGKKVMELSASIQESGLTNLAKLELIKRSKPWSESKVIVQVQMSDGGRMQREFVPAMSLFEILEAFEEDDGRQGHAKLLYHSDKTFHPVVIYVKDEIIGHHAMRETTLRSLGVLSGRIMLRHLYRQVSDETLQSINDEVDKEKERFQKMAEKAAALKEQEDKHAMTAGFHEILDPVTSEPPKGPEVIESRRGKEIKEETKKEMTTTSFGNVPTSIEPQIEAPTNPVVFKSEKKVMRNPPSNPFDNFKFPEETKGKNVYRNELSDVVKGEFQSCDRELVVFRLCEPMEVDNEREELPDTFFDVTETDLAIMQRDLEKTVKRLSEQPLQTQAMRQTEMEAKFSKYNRVIIRIQFPDRLVVQAVFQPRETVYAIYKFVKELLVNDCPSFHLYTAPPKHVLEDMTLNLVEAKLVPMTKIYFGSLNNVTEAPVKNDVIQAISSWVRADEVISKHVSKLKEDLKASPSNERILTGHQNNPAKGQTKTSATPKWLQLGKK